MAVPRQEGGIGGKGGKNVNPLYKAINSFNGYMANVAKEKQDLDNVEKKSGRNSEEFKKATNEYRGAVFQARRYND
jgi:hypothetical protein